MRFCKAADFRIHPNHLSADYADSRSPDSYRDNQRKSAKSVAKKKGRLDCSQRLSQQRQALQHFPREAIPGYEFAEMIFFVLHLDVA